MNRERLEHELVVLYRVPPDEFRISTWDCGYAACAMGWACRDPEFQAQGLRLLKRRDNRPIPGFEGMVGYNAAAEFFGVSRHTARRLFDPGKYGGHPTPVTPADVQARIRILLAGGEP